MAYSGRMNSRLARHEQRKLLRQSFILVLLAIVLVLGFIFVILPQSVRIIGSITGGTITSFEPDDTLAPQIPIFDAPPLATPSGSLSLSGAGEPQSTIVLVVNGSERDRTTAGDDGRFSFNVELDEGNNSVNAYAIDQSENESVTGQTFVIVRDGQPPKLEITEPQQNQTIELRRNQLTTIKGNSDPLARITVNGRLVLANKDGAFSTTYQLQEGENKLMIEAEDQAGNRTTQELIVTFRL